MATIVDQASSYRLELGLEEPCPRSALLKAARAGWCTERLAVELRQEVGAVEERAREEGVALVSAWRCNPRPERVALLAAARVWVENRAWTMRETARACGVQEMGLGRTLRRLGYTAAQIQERQSALLSRVNRARSARWRRRLLKRTKLALESGEVTTGRELAALLKVCVQVAHELLREAGHEGRRAAYLDAVDALEEAHALPPLLRPSHEEVARKLGVKLGTVREAAGALGYQWTRDRRDAVVAALRQLQVQEPGLSERAYARRIGCTKYLVRVAQQIISDTA